MEKSSSFYLSRSRFILIAIVLFLASLPIVGCERREGNPNGSQLTPTPALTWDEEALKESAQEGAKKMREQTNKPPIIVDWEKLNKDLKWLGERITTDDP